MILSPLLPSVALYAQAQPARFPESVVWNPESRGPLLIVLVAEEKSLQPVGVGSLTAFLPRERTELRWENLPKPDLLTDLSDTEKYQLLEASLTERQWKKLCSRAGLGLADLNRDQRRTFLALLPSPFVLQHNDEIKPLTDTEREQTRLRLSRQFDYYFVNALNVPVAVTLPEATTDTWRLITPLQPRQTWRLITPQTGTSIRSRFMGDPFLTTLTQIPGITLAPGLRQGFGFIDTTVGTAPQGSFGMTFTSSRSNSSKPGQLDFASTTLDPLVPLAGIQNLKQLVVRCGDVSKQELFCDPRYAGYQVHLRGTSARAGDLLQALARSVGGAWRRVGPGYVLTDDLMPLAIRMGHIHDWLGAAGDALTKARTGSEERAQTMQATYLQWSDEELAASPLGRSLESKREVPIPLRSLPPTLRGQAEKKIDYFHEHPNGDPNRMPLNREKIIGSSRLILELLPPDLPPLPVSWATQHHRGDTELPTLAPLPKSNLPKTLALMVSSVTEAQSAVATAKAQGFTALWVQIGLDDPEILAAAIQAGKTEGIPVSTLVRPLRTGAGTELTVEAKRSAVYLRPDALESQAAATPRLKTLAATPGLAGLILTDLYPTGYQNTNTDWKETLGYSENLRLTCLRRGGADPVDLTNAQLFRPLPFDPSLFGSVSFRLSLSPDRGILGSFQGAPWYGPSGPLWADFDGVRQDAVDAFAQALLATLKTAQPDLPLARQSRDGRFFAPTQRRLVLPKSNETRDIASFRAEWSQAVNEKKPPACLVFDATNRPLSEALTVLRSLQAQP